MNETQISLRHLLKAVGIGLFNRDETIDDDDRASLYSMDLERQHWAKKVDEPLSGTLILLVLATAISWVVCVILGAVNLKSPASTWAPVALDFMLYPAVLFPLLAVVDVITMRVFEKLGLGELFWVGNLADKGIEITMPDEIVTLLERAQAIPNHKVLLAGWCFRQSLKEWVPIWIYVYIACGDEREHIATFLAKGTTPSERYTIPMMTHWLMTHPAEG